jgi:hypothetical protein
MNLKKLILSILEEQPVETPTKPDTKPTTEPAKKPKLPVRIPGPDIKPNPDAKKKRIQKEIEAFKNRRK